MDLFNRMSKDMLEGYQRHVESLINAGYYNTQYSGGMPDLALVSSSLAGVTAAGIGGTYTVKDAILVKDWFEYEEDKFRPFFRLILGANFVPGGPPDNKANTSGGDKKKDALEAALIKLKDCFAQVNEETRLKEEALNQEMQTRGDQIVKDMNPFTLSNIGTEIIEAYIGYKVGQWVAKAAASVAISGLKGGLLGVAIGLAATPTYHSTRLFALFGEMGWRGNRMHAEQAKKLDNCYNIMNGVPGVRVVNVGWGGGRRLEFDNYQHRSLMYKHGLWTKPKWAK
jgi:hypothetical protein